MNGRSEDRALHVQILSYHMTSIHTGQKPHQCTQCDKAFASRSDFRFNIFVHTPGRNVINALSVDGDSQRKGLLSIHLASVHIGENFINAHNVDGDVHKY